MNVFKLKHPINVCDLSVKEFGNIVSIEFDVKDEMDSSRESIVLYSIKWWGDSRSNETIGAIDLIPF